MFLSVMLRHVRKTLAPTTAGTQQVTVVITVCHHSVSLLSVSLYILNMQELSSHHSSPWFS
jgi:hypothetical protein